MIQKILGFDLLIVDVQFLIWLLPLLSFCLFSSFPVFAINIIISIILLGKDTSPSLGIRFFTLFDCHLFDRFDNFFRIAPLS